MTFKEGHCMGLVEQRDSWVIEFEKGIKPHNPKLDEYKENRHKEVWRSSLVDERICEYILWLEGEVHRLGESVIELTEGGEQV
jgi:hypothetical protein